MVERQVRNLEVRGSTPLCSTNKAGYGLLFSISYNRRGLPETIGDAVLSILHIGQGLLRFWAKPVFIVQTLPVQYDFYTTENPINRARSAPRNQTVPKSAEHLAQTHRRPCPKTPLMDLPVFTVRFIDSAGQIHLEETSRLSKKCK